MGERNVRNVEVVGSTPILSTLKLGNASFRAFFISCRFLTSSDLVSAGQRGTQLVLRLLAACARSVFAQLLGRESLFSVGEFLLLSGRGASEPFVGGGFVFCVFVRERGRDEAAPSEALENAGN